MHVGIKRRTLLVDGRNVVLLLQEEGVGKGMFENTMGCGGNETYFLVDLQSIEIWDLPGDPNPEFRFSPGDQNSEIRDLSGDQQSNIHGRNRASKLNVSLEA